MNEEHVNTLVGALYFVEPSELSEVQRSQLANASGFYLGKLKAFREAKRKEKSDARAE